MAGMDGLGLAGKRAGVARVSATKAILSLSKNHEALAKSYRTVSVVGSIRCPLTSDRLHHRLPLRR